MLMKIRGLNKVSAKGRVYYYHRKTGTRLLAQFGTAAFLAEIEALDGVVAAQIEPRPGTLGALIAAYRASPEFAGLADRTKADYQRVFNYLKKLDGMALRKIDSAFVLRARDKAFAKRKRRFANYLLAVLSRLFSWGRPRNWVTGNPVEDLPTIARPRDMARANRPWKPDELAAVLKAAPEGIRAAVALGAYAGMREGDALLFPWSGYDRQSIEFRQGKTGEPVRMRAHLELRAILDATQKRSPTIVVGARGRPLTGAGFRAMFFKLVRALKKAGKVDKGLTFHGLRHTVGTRLAEDGVDNRDIMAVTGHSSEASVRVYTQGADRERRATATIKRLERIDKRSAKPTDGVAKPPRKPRSK